MPLLLAKVHVFDEPLLIPGASLGCPQCGGAFPPNATRTMRKGYYSAVTWTDYLIGELLDAVEARGIMNDTVVALLGDHGWQLVR